ncbi:NAD(P)/FAD-dependent oxidoreductase [Albibacterium bauzanense]|uniref:FAD/NAD(P)-binding domain-containing protein n=1 Tax=Albibacterium bauzanense TaxID=653929 RepID=A0A4R1M0U0_9SPHI|nr:NAD(P)/FAD-dependent oxidoreductase [Albibacterium bauzanense]TCK83243.1 hypothetical protein C8N28_1833 [Albibacterium bauzanense]
MQKVIELAIIPENIFDEKHLIQQASEKLSISSQRIKAVKIHKRSIDARGRRVVFRIQLIVYIDEEIFVPVFEFNPENVSDAKPVLIIGAGPAGLFAALQCIEDGMKPVIFERGKDVKNRRRDLAALNKLGVVNAESNYCFGEGGAGTYSDGKLYTRSNKRGDVQKVLDLFVYHGASSDILVDARPHIGTNKLPHIIEDIRRTIISAGGEIHFEKKVIDIETQFGKVRGLRMESGETVLADSVIVATGHSARDIYELFHRKNWLLEAKPFALGVRIEHPQELIDKVQYHCDIRGDYLPPAYYSLVEQIEQRGVFSFCMCPGGVIAPCATAEGEIVVNGWSPSKRNNPFANSGTVVQVNLNDVGNSVNNSLALLKFQKSIEEKAFILGGGSQVAPAQRMIDFVEGRVSTNLPLNSYKPGTRSVDLNDVLPDFIGNSLKQALPKFGKKMKGYFTNEAILVGVESRTSSPIRIVRDSQTLQHPQVKGLYPCAEGAGYAGGIVSAAIDGMNCAKAITKL